MSTTTLENAQTVTTTLNYYLDPSKGGHTEYQIGVTDYFRRKFDPHQVVIENIRGREGEFELDTHGFQHTRHGGRLDVDYPSREAVQEIVYPDTVDFIKRL